MKATKVLGKAYGDWNDHEGLHILCCKILDEYVSIPARVRYITVVLSDKPMAQSYRITRDGVSFKIDGKLMRLYLFLRVWIHQIMDKECVDILYGRIEYK